MEQLTFAAWPRLTDGLFDGIVNYTVDNAGSIAAHRWRDRLRFGPIYGGHLTDIVVTHDAVVEPADQRSCAVRLHHPPTLVDGWYDIDVELNLDGRGDAATLRFELRAAVLMAWTLPYHLVSR